MGFDLAIIFGGVLEMVSSGNYSGAVLSMMAVALFFLWKKVSKMQPHKKEEVKKTDYNKFIADDSIVMDELESIRIEHSADRAIILELRNGEVNLADIPSMKIYIRNERLKPMIFGISPITNGIPASFYSGMLKTLVKDSNYELPDVNSLRDVDFGLFQNLISSNVKSLYAFPLFDSNNTFYGCFMLQYCSKIKGMTGEEILNASHDAARINGEVLVMKKVKNHNP